MDRRRAKHEWRLAHMGKGRKPWDRMMGKVLIIHTHELPLDTFRFFFAQGGYHVETATSGEQGMEKLHTEPFDLVIADARPPGSDANRIARHIRNAHGGHLPLVAIGPTSMLKPCHFDLVLSNPLDLMLVREFLTRILHGWIDDEVGNSASRVENRGDQDCRQAGRRKRGHRS